MLQVSTAETSQNFGPPQQPLSLSIELSSERLELLPLILESQKPDWPYHHERSHIGNSCGINWGHPYGTTLTLKRMPLSNDPLTGSTSLSLRHVLLEIAFQDDLGRAIQPRILDI